MPSSYTLGSHFEAFIREMTESGRYNSASEVLRDGLRLLEDRERLRALKVADLRRKIEEAQADPTLLSEEEVFEQLEANSPDAAAQRRHA